MNIYYVRAMDLHAPSEMCEEKCMVVVLASEHDAEIKALASRLSTGLKLLDDWLEAEQLGAGIPIRAGVAMLQEALHGRIVERHTPKSETCPREGCPYVDGPDFSIGNPCRCNEPGDGLGIWRHNT